MDRCARYHYKVRLETSRDVIDFNKAATTFRGNVYLVNGSQKLNAKSFLGVHLARLTWDEIFVESEENCYFDFRKFIVE